MYEILGQKFFNRKAPLVARELLGKFLVRRFESGEAFELMINEVEAYDGFEDKASHAHRGRTLRNAVMFGPAGFWYVYFCYGVHFMLNIVTEQEGYPSAVLIRGAEEAKDLRSGRAHAGAGSQISGMGRKLVSGPGRLTKFLGIDKGFNCKEACPASDLWISDRGIVVDEARVKVTPRIGVSYAGPVWAKKEWRFVAE